MVSWLIVKLKKSFSSLLCGTFTVDVDILSDKVLLGLYNVIIFMVGIYIYLLTMCIVWMYVQEQSSFICA